MHLSPQPQSRSLLALRFAAKQACSTTNTHAPPAGRRGDSPCANESQAWSLGVSVSTGWAEAMAAAHPTPFDGKAVKALQANLQGQVVMPSDAPLRGFSAPSSPTCANSRSFVPNSSSTARVFQGSVWECLEVLRRRRIRFVDHHTFWRPQYGRLQHERRHGHRHQPAERRVCRYGAQGGGGRAGHQLGASQRHAGRLQPARAHRHLR